MWQSLFVSIFFYSILERENILDKAGESGFYYRNAVISEVSECSGDNKEICVTHNGRKYLVKKEGDFSFSAESAGSSLQLEMIPDNRYISYFLYIQTEDDVHKIKIVKKKISIDQNTDKIIKVQVVGTGVNGPEVIWCKEFRKTKVPQFSGSFDNSLKKLRLQYKRKFLSVDQTLEQSAQASLHKVKNEGTKHYSSKEGSIRHSGVRKKTLGENLFTAKNEEEAWEMLVSSPSHLYNLINPQYKHYFYAVSKEKDEIFGAIIFSD